MAALTGMLLPSPDTLGCLRLQALDHHGIFPSVLFINYFCVGLQLSSSPDKQCLQQRQQREQAGDWEPWVVAVGQLAPCKPFPSRIAVPMLDCKSQQWDFCLPPSSACEEDPDAPYQ